MVNIFLSGGGMKGAYQYGFIKQIYKQTPNFKVDKVYASSIGSINSLPILTKRMASLGDFWEKPDIINKVLIPWNRVMDSSTLFQGIRRDPFDFFLDQITDVEWKIIQEKLTIIAYNKVIDSPVVFANFESKSQLVDSICASACFPGLYPPTNPNIIDGSLSTFDIVEYESKNEDWLILDLNGKSPHIFRNVENKKKHIHRPDQSRNLFYNNLSCINFTSCHLQSLIKNGEEHANIYLDRIR